MNVDALRERYEDRMWPKPPAPGTRTWNTYYAAKALANAHTSGFDVRSDRADDADEIYALARREGYGASARSPGYMHLRPLTATEKRDRGY